MINGLYVPHNYIIMPVLLAYDVKHHHESVLDYAIRYAVAFRTQLYILSSVTSKDGGKELDSVKASLEDAKRKASEMGAEAFTLIGVGPAAEEILAAAERIDAKAIIVGHSDKTAIDRIFSGTVSEYVLRHTGRTVIFVR